MPGEALIRKRREKGWGQGQGEGERLGLGPRMGKWRRGIEGRGQIIPRMHASETSVAHAGTGDHMPCQPAAMAGGLFAPACFDILDMRSRGRDEATAMAVLALALGSRRWPMSDGATLAVLKVILLPEGVGSMHQAPALTFPASVRP